MKLLVTAFIVVRRSPSTSVQSAPQNNSSIASAHDGSKEIETGPHD